MPNHFVIQITDIRVIALTCPKGPNGLDWPKGFTGIGTVGGEPNSLKWDNCSDKAIVPSSTTVAMTHKGSKTQKNVWLFQFKVFLLIYLQNNYH